MTEIPQSYEVRILPEFQEPGQGPAGPLRSALVEATGEEGNSGYPRYEGEGVVADIDPRSGAVEGLLVDGSELEYGLIARAVKPGQDAPKKQGRKKG